MKAAGGGDVPNVKVTVDEVAVSAAALGIKSVANPGPHTVRASADGFTPATVSITVPVGGAVDAPLTLEKDLSAPPPEPTAPAQPSPEQPPTASSGHSIWPWVAFGVGGVGLGLGAVGVAAGVTLLVLQPKASDAAAPGPAASLVVGPGSIAAIGRF